jgi:HEAT repeat protein
MNAAGPGGGGPPASQATIDPASEAVNSIGRIVASQVAKGGSPSEEVVATLLKAFRSGRPALRGAAEQALTRIGKGASAAVPDLIKALTESTTDVLPGDGPSAASLLGAIAPGTSEAPKAIAALVVALDSKDSDPSKGHDTRINAAVALGKFGPAAKDVLPRLVELGGDPDKEVASAAKAAADRIEGKTPPDAPRRKRGGGPPRR